MALVNVFGDLSLEETNKGILLLLSAILEKLPRATANDQSAVRLEDIGANLTLSAVSLLGDLQRAGGKYASGDNVNMSGTAHIYNNITVS